MTMGGRVLRRSEELRSCGVSDGCTIQLTNRMRRGGRHKDKKSKVDKKATISSKRSEQLQVQVIQECDKDAVIRKLEGYRESKAEKNQATGPEKLEQMSVEELTRDKSPTIQGQLKPNEQDLDEVLRQMKVNEWFQKMIMEGSVFEVEKREGSGLG